MDFKLATLSKIKNWFRPIMALVLSVLLMRGTIMALVYSNLARWDGARPAYATDDKWWDTDWTYRKKLTFDNSGQAENLTNFPVLVKLSSSNFDFTRAKTNGEDIRFVDAGANHGDSILKHEIEKWDNANSQAWVWVKVPQIDSSSSTDYIFMYYGNSGASDAQDAANVWDVNHVMVQHLQEDPSGAAPQMIDSTSNDNDGTSFGSMTSGDQVAGQINGSLDFDGTNAYINVPHKSSIDPIAAWTLEAWVKRDATGSQDGLLEKYDWAAGKGNYGLRITSSDKLYTFIINGTSFQGTPTGTATLNSTTAWYYVVATFNASTDTLTSYVNGNQDAQNTSATINPPASSLSLKIGARGNEAGEKLDGIIDEPRISDTARSADWIAAQYLSTSDSFVTYGDQAACSGEVTTDVTGTVKSVISISVSGTVDIGNVTPGTPQIGTGDVTVTSNSETGWGLYNYADDYMTKTTIPYSSITDVPPGSAGAPAPWTAGTTKGLGFSLSGPTAEAKWNAFNYSSFTTTSAGAALVNNYTTWSNIPENLSVLYALDVDPDQLTGPYQAKVSWFAITHL